MATQQQGRQVNLRSRDLVKPTPLGVGRAALALLCHEFDLSAGHVRLVTEHEEKSVHGRASQRGKTFGRGGGL